MHTPPNPEPTPDTPPVPDQPRAPVAGSTGAYHHPLPAPGSSLIELLGSSFVRLKPAADSPTPVSRADLDALAIAGNSDDFPTVITSANKPDLTAANANLHGQKLGHFELLEAIGAGGMATVLKARDLELGRIVALKILPPDTAKDAEVVTRFKQEARAAAKLDHENIARVYYYGEDRSLHYIAFEFVEGENLRQLIDRRGTISTPDCVRYLLQVAAGLTHASERGVVHRDVKPSNILITPDGRAKIVDMGLARHLESHSVNGGVTQSGVTLGTFDYISPEQAMDPRRADVRSDIYSLGCTFYHALTGRPPVPEGTAAKKLHAHQHENPIDPRDLNGTIPDAMAVVLAKMMAKDPARRYATPNELIREVSALARQWNVPMEPTGGNSAEHVPLTPAPTPTHFVPNLPRLPLGLLAAAAAIVVAAVALFADHRGFSPSGTPVPWKEINTPTKGTEFAALAPALAPATVPATTPIVAKPTGIVDAQSLADAIASRTSPNLSLTLRPGTEYDLSTLADGLNFTGGQLTLEAEAGPQAKSRPPILRLMATPTGLNRPGSFTARDATRVTLRGLEIQIADPTEPVPESDPVGLWFSNVGQVELEGCRVLMAPGSSKNRLVGVAVDHEPSQAPPQVIVHHGWFHVGLQSVALRLADRAKATISELGFAPHAAAIQIVPTPNTNSTTHGELHLRQCTFLLDRGGAAISADPETLCLVTAGACVFGESAPMVDKLMMPGMATTESGATVFAGEAAEARFSGTEGNLPNGYYRVSAPAGETRAVLLARPPWSADDPRPLLETAEPWASFKLNILTDRKLGLPAPTHVMGAKALLGPNLSDMIYKERDGVPSWPPPRPQLPVKAGMGEIVVFKDAEPSDADARIVPTFEKAFADAKTGERILIAENGPLAIADFVVRTSKLSIEAYPGYTPTLTPEGPARLKDASLIQLSDGELSFVGLRFSLINRQSLVTISGGKRCTFRDCIITLDRKDDADPDGPAVVVFPDPALEMRMTPMLSLTGPRVQWTNCLVRGRGHMAWSQAARPWELIATNTAVALDGSFIVAEPSIKESSTTPPVVTVKLSNCTTTLTGPLVELHAGPSGFNGSAVQIQLDVERSFFAPLEQRRTAPTLILVHDADLPAEATKYLTWRAGVGNIYGNYERATLVEMRPPAIDSIPPTELDWEKWQTLTRDPGRAAAISFANGSLKSKLLTLKASDFKAKFQSTDPTPQKFVTAGADPEKLPKE